MLDLLDNMNTFTKGGSYWALLGYVTQLCKGGLLQFFGWVLDFFRGGGGGFLFLGNWF